MFDVNKFAVNQDYEFASELIQALEKNITKEDPELIRKKLFYFEGIFLDLTDRTGAHPTVPFAHEDRGGVMQDFVKLLGFGNRKIVWEFNELFNEDTYFANEWFPPSLKMNSNLCDDLNRAKEMYWEREINFFEYFIRRLQVYSELEASLFMKHYKGIDMETYKSKLRKIFDGYPVVTKPGELDF